MDNYEEIARKILSIMPQIKCISEKKFHVNRLAKGEGFMLGILRHHDGHMMAGELAKIMDVSTARIATICNALEERGLIERRAVSGDRRKCEVFLTESGNDSCTKNYNEILNHMTHVLETLGREDAESLLRISEKSLKLLKEHV